MQIYIDGKFYSEQEAKISVFDHGLLYGDGVFEGIRSYNRRVFMLEEHLDRLYDSMKGILLQPQWTKTEMREIVLETLRRNKLDNAYVRLVVTRGFGNLGLDMRQCPKPTLIVIAGQIQLYSKTYYEQGLNVVTSGLRRPSADTLNPNIKTLNYLNNIMARAQAASAGAQEALMLNAQGHVAECTGDNVFYVKNGEVSTPPLSAGLLDGITRRAAISLLRTKLKLPVREELFSLFQLMCADEMFLTGTGAEIVPVATLDGRPVGSDKAGPVTRKLMVEFKKFASANGVRY